MWKESGRDEPLWRSLTKCTCGMSTRDSKPPVAMECIHAGEMKYLCGDSQLMQAASGCPCSGEPLIALQQGISVLRSNSPRHKDVPMFRGTARHAATRCLRSGKVFVTLQRGVSVPGRCSSRCNEVSPFQEGVRHAAMRCFRSGEMINSASRRYNFRPGDSPRCGQITGDTGIRSRPIKY